MWAVSRVSIFLTLVSYVYSGSVISARKVFIVSAFYNILNESMVHFWPLALTFCAEGYISVNRLRDFLSRGVLDGLVFERMRLFRKRERLLTSAAISFLCEVVWTDATASEDYLASPGFCVAAEFAIQASAVLRSKLMRRVADVLSQRGRPQDIAQLSYLLLNTGWTMP